MRLLAITLTLLAACGSSDPSPGKGDGGPNDTAVTPDVSPEASADAAAPDVAAVGDAAAEAGLDAPAADAPPDVAAVGDVGPDAPAPDVARDAALEAAADAPAPDPLGVAASEPGAQVLYGTTCAPGPACAPSERGEARAPVACAVLTAGGLTFNFRACETGVDICDTLTGDQMVVSVQGPEGASVAALSPRVTYGAPYSAGGSMRRNARVQFRADATRTAHGVAGLPGRTRDPELGEVLLLGCPVR